MLEVKETDGVETFGNDADEKLAAIPEEGFPEVELADVQRGNMLDTETEKVASKAVQVSANDFQPLPATISKAPCIENMETETPSPEVKEGTLVEIEETPNADAKEVPSPVVKEAPVAEVKEAPIIEDKPIPEVKESPITEVKVSPPLEAKKAPVTGVKEAPAIEDEVPAAEIKEAPVPVVKEAPVVEDKEMPIPGIKKTSVTEVKEAPVAVKDVPTPGVKEALVADELPTRQVKEPPVTEAKEAPAIEDDVPVAEMKDAPVTKSKEAVFAEVKEAPVIDVKETPVTKVKEAPVSAVKEAFAPEFKEAPVIEDEGVLVAEMKEPPVTEVIELPVAEMKDEDKEVSVTEVKEPLAPEEVLVTEAKEATTPEAKEAPVTTVIPTRLPTPKVKDIPVTEVKGALVPEVKDAPAIEDKETPVTEMKEAPVAEVKKLSTPEFKQAPVTEVKEVAVAEVKEAPVPEIKGTPLSEAADLDKTTAAKIKDVPITEAEETSGTELQEIPFPQVETPVIELKEAPLAEVKYTHATGVKETPLTELEDTPVPKAPVPVLKDTPVMEIEKACVTEGNKTPGTEMTDSPATKVKEAPGTTKIPVPVTKKAPVNVTPVNRKDAEVKETPHAEVIGSTPTSMVKEVPVTKIPVPVNKKTPISEVKEKLVTEMKSASVPGKTPTRDVEKIPVLGTEVKEATTVDINEVPVHGVVVKQARVPEEQVTSKTEVVLQTEKAEKKKSPTTPKKVTFEADMRQPSPAEGSKVKEVPSPKATQQLPLVNGDTTERQEAVPATGVFIQDTGDRGNESAPSDKLVCADVELGGDSDEVITLPGISPDPVPSGSSSEDSGAAGQRSRSKSPQPPGRSRSKSPQPAPKQPVKKSPSGVKSRAQQQLEFLEERQKQFKMAALKAKNEGDMEHAKTLLRQAKGFDPMIEAAQGGLPVDLTKIPSLPSEPLDVDEFLESAEEADPAKIGDSEEMYARLAHTLKKQIETCKTSSEQYTHLGDLQEATKLERMGQASRQDLDTVKNAHNHGDPPPRFHYETRTFRLVKINTELLDSDLEVSVLRGVAYPLPSGISEPKDLYTYVKFELPYPHDKPQESSTSTFKGDANPEYKHTEKFRIDRKARSWLGTVKRKAIKFEVFYERGFLRSDKSMGEAQLKLENLENKAEVHEIIDLKDGRKTCGGKLEVKVRQREPLTGKQVQHVQEKWLVIDSVKRRQDGAGTSPQSSSQGRNPGRCVCCCSVRSKMCSVV
ncbi:coiled-coil and C2 domain-containing protein 1B-like isoform X2 [Branchiostoma floridae]|uniref:Coiled-coil and C2 domain-containing protein 1B-like isoform X2 n=1 Tax=Branchiostoma floridae TaxID=7739 RepID=A0A9J7MH48_BRAFL|nr:coiled-coil and C2 domain-containing protein 1B-like isoform X2 [Branchiostoma floridae]